MKFTPYLTFNGTVKAALTFYQKVLGGSLNISTAQELFHPEDHAIGHLIVHGVLTVNDHLQISALDVIPGAPAVQPGHTVSMGLTFHNIVTASSIFEKLAENGKVIIKFAPKDWGGTFGIIEDQFGVRWNISA